MSPRWGTVIEGDVPLDPDIDKFAGVRICVRMDTVAVLVEDDIVAREKRAGETLQVQAVSVPEVRSIPAVVVDDTARNLEIHEIGIRVESGPTVMNDQIDVFGMRGPIHDDIRTGIMVDHCKIADGI